MTQLIYVTKHNSENEMGGRQQISRLHGGLLLDLLGHKFATAVFDASASTGKLLGYIDGVSSSSIASVVARIRSSGARQVFLDGSNLGDRNANTSAWIASSVKPISRLEVLAAQAPAAVAENYADGALVNNAAREVLHALGRDGPVMPGQLQSSLAFLAAEADAIDRRERLVTQGWVGRKLAALSLLLSGGYGHFNGYRSFVRDVCR